MTSVTAHHLALHLLSLLFLVFILNLYFLNDLKVIALCHVSEAVLFLFCCDVNSLRVTMSYEFMTNYILFSCVIILLPSNDNHHDITFVYFDFYLVRFSCHAFISEWKLKRRSIGSVSLTESMRERDGRSYLTVVVVGNHAREEEFIAVICSI